MRDVRVLIITGKDDTYPRQLPGGRPYLERGDRNYHFFINDDTCEPDIVVVRNKHLKSERTFKVAQENTILMISEPRSVVSFAKKYRDQFGMFYTCQAELTHKNIVYGPALLPWTFDVTRKDGKATHWMNFDDLMASPLPEKSKDLSIIISNKAHTRGHQARLDFVYKLKEHYGDKLDLYGRGFKSFDEKWSVMAPYRYHIAIENSQGKDYWTEKLSDSYVCGCYPIYYGCTNTEEYFDKDSFAKIDINDVDGAIKIIDEILSKDTYSEKKELIEKGRELALVKYDMFHIIADCCDKLDIDRPKQEVRLKPCKSSTDLRHLYNNIVERNILSVQNMVKKLMGRRKF